jgi:threonine dehydrogenase-like Zn-dependent dehydrogenase
MCPDIMSTGFSGAERGGVTLGDSVAVFALGPIGLCAVAGPGCSVRPPSLASIPWPSVSASPAAWVPTIVDFRQGNVVEQIMALTGGRGVDVAIEALGTQATFEAALRVLRPGGTLSSLGVQHRPAHTTGPVRCRPG